MVVAIQDEWQRLLFANWVQALLMERFGLHGTQGTWEFLIDQAGRKVVLDIRAPAFQLRWSSSDEDRPAVDAIIKEAWRRTRARDLGPGTWTLRDLKTGEQYRSGSDSTPARPWDAAYLGRLPRPDGQGSLLVFTGIHPPGTLGVVHLLASELTNLYEQVGTGTFSTLVGVDYDPASHEPISVQLLTSLYAHTKE